MSFLNVFIMDQISLKTPNPKCRLFLKIDQERYLAAGVYLSEAPPSHPRFLFGVVKHFVGSESGQLYSVYCITTVYALHTTRYPPPLHTV